MAKETKIGGNSSSSSNNKTILNGKMRKEFKQQKNKRMNFSFGFLKSKLILNFCLIIAIIILIGNGNANEIRTSFPFELNLFENELNEIPPQFQLKYSNNLEFLKRSINNNNNIPPSILPLKPQKRRMVVRVPFASQNPDGSQLSRIYKQLFEPTATRTKKQPFSPFYQRYLMEAATKGEENGGNKI
ncbi:unnamed protein product [Meloidogyne enterolobii]|uniref:Uncharacterized protein n=1 Tax=Meloidogyne enterolobii TaxID=390850 RepID=A0ACB0Z7Q6_MELEN